jgi:glycosyltransferase involved in cell wall biosynthesis
MAKLLLVSHNPRLTTGYGRVTSVLAGALAAAGHEVAVLGLGYAGESHARPYPILPAASLDSIEIINAITSHHPDVLITIGDPWMFESVPALPARRAVKWLAYFPVDGHPLPSAWANWVRDVDLPVVFAQYTRRVIETATGLTPQVIPHGVDLATFRPLDKAWAKRRVGVDGRFVVGTVAANQQRKNLPALVRAFADFARDKDDVILYLHTQIAPGGYWEIDELVRRFGVEPKTRATLNLDPQRGVPDQTLATIYNAFDVFALPTMAEGFGLPILESQACAAPALVTNFSACSELLPEDFCRLRVKDTLIMARNFEQAIVDEADLSAKLARLYQDRTELARLGKTAQAFATQFSWTAVSAQFVECVARVAPHTRRPHPSP